MIIQQTTIREIARSIVESTVYDVYERPAHPMEDHTERMTAEIRRQLENSGQFVQRKRLAIVAGHSDLDTIRKYLPRGYSAKSIGKADGVERILIEGYDDHGWTLHEYVIPSLASGLICAKEVT